MTRLRRLVAAVLAALALASLAVAWADVPLDVVERGLVGYGLTEGPDGIERFEVEVLGLQYDPAGGFPLVLVRTSGPIIDAAGGVAAGMSGSPVYVDIDGVDELLGAIGYTFPRAEGNLALVTPVAAMRDVLRDVRLGAAEAPAGSRRASSAVTPAGVGDGGLGPAVPVTTPVLVAGLGARALAELAPLWGSAGLEPMPIQAGTTSTDAGPNDLVPGSAVAVHLARGDVTVAAIGTLTLAETGEFLAFGHPLLGAGVIDYALTPAYVTAVVPSRDVPFKLANAGSDVVGAVHLDRRAGIGGSLDAEPDLLPFTLTLRGGDGPATYQVDLARHPRLTPALVAATVLQALDTARGATTGGWASLAWNLNLGSGERLSLVDDAGSATDLARAVARLAAAPIHTLEANPYADPDLTSIELVVETDAVRRDADLVDVDLARSELAPDATAELFVRLQPYRDEAIVETMTVPLPSVLSDGLEPGERREIRLLVRGGNVPRPDLGDQANQASEPPILSFGELLEAMRSDPQARELIVEVVVDGEWRRLERLTTPYIVTGSDELVLTLVAPSAADAPEDERTSSP